MALGGRGIGRPRGHLLPGGPNPFTYELPLAGPGVPGAHSPSPSSVTLFGYAWSGFGSSQRQGRYLLFWTLFLLSVQNQLIANTCLSPGLLQVRKHDKTASASSPSFLKLPPVDPKPDCALVGLCNASPTAASPSPASPPTWGKNRWKEKNLCLPRAWWKSAPSP